MEDYTGFPLHFLAKSDRFYSKFQERLADPNQRDFEGNTLLHAAARTSADNSKTLQLLLDRGASVDSTNPDGHTALHFAVYFRNRCAVAALLEAGSSINSKDSMGRTALHFAINEKWPNCSSRSILNLGYDKWIFERLICHPGINTNLADSTGETPLMFAVKAGNTAATELLLKKGANPNIPNKNGRTPLHVLLSSGNTNDSVVSLFLQKGAGIYCKDISGKTVVDILVRKVRSHNILEFAKRVVRLIALKYRIKDCLRRKLQQIPYLYHYFEVCLEEVDLMKKQGISDNITLHDFCLDCYETGFGDPEEVRYKPVFEILSSGLFKMYHNVILSRLSGRDEKHVSRRKEKLFAHPHVKLSLHLLSIQRFLPGSFELKRHVR